MSAQFTNVITGQPTELSVKGDMFGMDATIFLNESVPIAQISRQYMNAREIFTDNQTYFVTVAPGVDLALMAAVCICFDEAKNEKN